MAGSLEVEVNATAANAVTVTQNLEPAAPPSGFLFVDPTTFVIKTDSATDEATDVVKVRVSQLLHSSYMLNSL